ncbi:MAG: outer membrane lipoprotein chaperone LolA [Gammaproteobacteria bacterium]|nr:outer membrane lipoprotein chaperone LolA [Gammaproteobacteria bacterium]
MSRSFGVLAVSIALGLVGVMPVVANAATGQMTTQVAATEAQATAKLNGLLGKISSLQANFSQTTKATTPTKSIPQKQGLKSSHLGQTFSGVMQVKRQGLFRWETTSPMKQLIVTSGKIVWIYDPDLLQATRQTLDEQMSNTPALLLSGNAAQIMKSYKVTQPNSAIPYFVLYPRAKDGVFESLAIRFDANVPAQMVLSDSLGQQTTVNFTDIKVNPEIARSQFEFVPPKGADVIDQ